MTERDRTPISRATEDQAGHEPEVEGHSHRMRAMPDAAQVPVAEGETGSEAEVTGHAWHGETPAEGEEYMPFGRWGTSDETWDSVAEGDDDGDESAVQGYWIKAD